MKKYFDYEYRRIVTEEVIKRQYEHFKKVGVKEDYRTFLNDNFYEITSEKEYENIARYWVY